MNHTSIGQLFWFNADNGLTKVMTAGSAFVMQFESKTYVVSAKHCFERNPNIPDDLVNLN